MTHSTMEFFAGCIKKQPVTEAFTHHFSEIWQWLRLAAAEFVQEPQRLYGDECVSRIYVL